MKKKTIGIIIISVLAATAIFSGIMFVRQHNDAKSSKESFDSLADLIVETQPEEAIEPVENDAEESAELSEEELAAIEAAAAQEK